MANDVVAEVGERAWRVALFDRALDEAKKQLQEAQAKVESLTAICSKEKKDLDARKATARDELKKEKTK